MDAGETMATASELQHLHLQPEGRSVMSQRMMQDPRTSQGVVPYSPHGELVPHRSSPTVNALQVSTSNTQQLGFISGNNNMVLHAGTINIFQGSGATAAPPGRSQANLPLQNEDGRQQNRHTSNRAEMGCGVQIEEFPDEDSASLHEQVECTPSPERPQLFLDQLELAEDAVQGKNTVLVAPTGSGKTHVAGYIIHDHFIAERPKPVWNRRALFLVTTVNLVEQQSNKLKFLLERDNFFSVVGIHGTSELSLKEEAKKRNVIVVTAQLLENALSYIPLDYFSLLVFDECHLCQKDHAYNTIMARYMDEKDRGNFNLPQIVGMTASLGTGKAKEQMDADNHAIQICANMDAQSISLVIRNRTALESRVNIPKEVKPIEVSCRKIDPFADKIKEIMKRIETMLNDSPYSAVRMSVNSEPIPSELGSQAFRQWCDRMKRCSQKIITLYEGVPYRILQACISQLKEYNAALLINKQVRTKDAFNYLANMMDKMNDRRRKFDDNDRELWLLYNREERILERIKDDPNNENPLLEKLCEIILAEYSIRPHSRAILFVKTIDTTQALQDWITETPELKFLNPGRIAGSRDMKSNQQNKVIEKFRNGEHKMLVATNLLEQGTDVPECNLVIRLDYVPSDFGHVQIKGRTRAKGGRSYLITLVDSNGAARDSANRQREIMMMEAAQHLKDMTQSSFKNHMESWQRSNRSERQIKEEKKRLALEANCDEVFVFCCSRCSKPAFLSRDVGRYKNCTYLVLDVDFSQHMEIRPHPKPKQLGANLTIIGKMFCKKCGHDWGSLTHIKQLYYPSAKISQFTLRSYNTGLAHTFKKWRDATFKVKDLVALPPDAAVEVAPDVLRKLEINLP
ncbi:probable ATP-dependent RNA helicase DDX58 isoform X2 [Acanthaster planci]|uniref:RNA helicase n=1 Tax=Acanthaster planci TaxID=133434 RepID=A0A8B7ZG05_ACAPL|nr:probable ATP-dependent RNA helicase DDX58 isoform X2 [Acanthaster planci]